MPKRAKIGDIFEIPIKDGFAYAQYTHQHGLMGGLIRVFEVVATTRPHNLSQIAQGPVRFSTFFPVRAAINRGIFQVIGNTEVTVENRVFPVFRSGIPGPLGKDDTVWWLWDGKKSEKVGKLPAHLKKMPIRDTWNDSLLIQRIEEQWTPESDTE